MLLEEFQTWGTRRLTPVTIFDNEKTFQAKIDCANKIGFGLWISTTEGTLHSTSYLIESNSGFLEAEYLHLYLDVERVDR